MSGGTVEFLLVQDDPAEVLFLRETWELHKVANPVHAVRDVRQARAYLDREPPYETARPPDVVLLDLNLPGHDGRRLLRQLRERPDTAHTPVIILVDSSAAEHIVRAEFLPVQGYATKPVDFACLTAIVRGLESTAFMVLRSA
ncbi:response regulator [Nucisporomicrobium flavum]|uniref:response regulator n=1 Tax=Nucisporomicrobium flavum TaxID=2785915 RepID=UPI0018F7BADB|nr:response regulator [Nucisporomicrobium flavum]